MLNEDRLALVQEVLPRTLRSLFLLRMSLCAVAAGLALIKILLSPPLAAFFLDILSEDAPKLGAWMHALNLTVSGLLAVALSLVIATFFTQARLRAHAASQEDANLPV